MRGFFRMLGSKIFLGSLLGAAMTVVSDPHNPKSWGDAVAIVLAGAGLHEVHSSTTGNGSSTDSPGSGK